MKKKFYYKLLNSRSSFFLPKNFYFHVCKKTAGYNLLDIENVVAVKVIGFSLLPLILFLSFSTIVFNLLFHWCLAFLTELKALFSLFSGMFSLVWCIKCVLIYCYLLFNLLFKDVQWLISVFKLMITVGLTQKLLTRLTCYFSTKAKIIPRKH